MQSFGIRVNMVSPGRIKVTHENEAADENGEDREIEEDIYVHVRQSHCKEGDVIIIYSCQ